MAVARACFFQPLDQCGIVIVSVPRTFSHCVEFTGLEAVSLVRTGRSLVEFEATNSEVM